MAGEFVGEERSSERQGSVPEPEGSPGASRPLRPGVRAADSTQGQPMTPVWDQVQPSLAVHGGREATGA